jgi:ribose transport system ATP-binding protein
MHVDRGEIVALLGENGAGKSTLIKVLGGIHTADSGTITFGGDTLDDASRHRSIAFIHQDLGLIDWMTVAENICLGLGYPRRHGLVDWAKAREQAARALREMGADIDPDARIQSLDRTEKSIVAISRALVANAALVVLDEPTASLPANEVARLFGSLRKLKDRGVAMIYVSHRLDEVFEIADRMVVLRDGGVVGDKAVADVSPAEAIVMIVGHAPADIFKRAPDVRGAARLSLEGMRIGDVGPVDAQFHSGEVVGLVGLRGAGQELVGRCLFGLEPLTAGRIRLDGEPVNVRNPREAIAAGLHLVWGDRAAGSIVPTLSVRENLYLNPGASGLAPWTYLAPAAESAAAISLGARLHLRPNEPSMPIEALSGGNQQKVVVGRWLHLRGKVYLFEDPTAGVDVGAKAEIYRLFNEVTSLGGCIIVLSTDFEEVANVCHRALVFDRGTIVAELEGDQLSVNALLAAASARIVPASSPTPSLHG